MILTAGRNEGLIGLIIWGARGHGKVLAEIAEMANVPVRAVFDRDESLPAPLQGVPLFVEKDFER